jgi:hypothetical protein
MTNIDEKIAALTAEVERLKAREPTPFDEASVAAQRDRNHQASERRMRGASAFTREQLREMAAACSTADVQDIRRRGAIPGPSQAGSSGQITKTSTNAGLVGSNTSGWTAPRPFVRDDLPPWRRSTSGAGRVAARPPTQLQ